MTLRDVRDLVRYDPGEFRFSPELMPTNPPGSAKALTCGSMIRKKVNCWRESALAATSL